MRSTKASKRTAIASPKTMPTRKIGIMLMIGPVDSTPSIAGRGLGGQGVTRWLLEASVRSSAVALKETVAYAVVPSSLTVFAWNGSTAEATWEPSAVEGTSLSTAALLSAR
ncbi:hypothetical protein QF037_005017 [Streptomyces canus]|uniref:hypothetical protein n=1 Tax=Streptomyces canus TaxID=58343 RepID=UPI002781D814|nr:hypothetical protein [Streptomyces canus]